MSKKIKSLVMVLLAIPVAIFGITSTASAYATQLVLGTSDYTYYQYQTSISADGRYVAFLSNASNLVPNDTNSRTDAFLKDTVTGQITMLSSTPSGTPGNGHTSDTIMLTGNGRFVLFNSEASNLASTPGEYNQKNVYLRDILSSTTYLIAKGLSGSGVSQYPIGLSEDGRFVYYSTTGPAAFSGIYALDRILNTVERINTDDTGTVTASMIKANNDGRFVSCDGRYVVLISGESTLVPGDTNGASDVFLIDHMNGHVVKNITLGANGNSNGAEISCDGNFILFQSNASNLVDSDTNNAMDLFKYRVSDSSIERVSVNDDESEYAGGAASLAGGYSTGGSMSMDGRYVYYVFGYRNTADRSYLVMRDTVAGTTNIISPSGSNYYSWNPTASYDGRKVFYTSTSTFRGDYPQLRLVTGHVL